MYWVKDMFITILQMTPILMYGRSLIVIKVGKFLYRGRLEDGEDEKFGNRSGSGGADNFHQLIESNNQTCQTLNSIRAFRLGLYFDINCLNSWNLNFLDKTD